MPILLSSGRALVPLSNQLELSLRELDVRNALLGEGQVDGSLLEIGREPLQPLPERRVAVRLDLGRPGPSLIREFSILFLPGRVVVGGQDYDHRID